MLYYGPGDTVLRQQSYITQYPSSSSTFAIKVNELQCSQFGFHDRVIVAWLQSDSFTVVFYIYCSTYSRGLVKMT